MNTASKLGPHTQWTEGRAPVWGSEFTSKDAALQGRGGGLRRISAQPFCRGGSKKSMPSPSEVALGPFISRVLVHEVARTEELAKRRRAHSADHAGLEEHRVWYVLATRPRGKARCCDRAARRCRRSTLRCRRCRACAQSRAKKQPRGEEHAA